ncbi:hypothetical protein BD410DRAFT_185542 [Rickenella mellea]|uniref:Peptidase C14 caspase domain-containing protein n=1 Tax=Rickenella mellea TaxID=50990 RepID=A0A4Y7Q6Z8_9AGAM|nr:hypothetical protein BD410DRAFT_185542 [Rickenella mellea]
MVDHLKEVHGGMFARMGHGIHRRHTLQTFFPVPSEHRVIADLSHDFASAKRDTTAVVTRVSEDDTDEEVGFDMIPPTPTSDFLDVFHDPRPKNIVEMPIRQDGPQIMGLEFLRQTEAPNEFLVEPPPLAEERLTDKRPGRRRALLIGIEYGHDPRIALDGPHDDVDELKRLLQDVYRWNENCFVVLKDDGTNEERQPTRDIIRKEIANLIDDVEAGDTLFVYFAGHGTQVEDLDGDEEDGKDEAIVTCDGYKILDDELFEILVKPLPIGCRLIALFDCCNSGTQLDLPIVLSAEFCQSALAQGAITTNNIPDCAPQLPWTRERSFFSRPQMFRKLSDGDVVLWSACHDAQRAHGVRNPNNRVMGAMTYAFVDSLRKRKDQTYQQLLDSICEKMKGWRLRQSPQLSSSHDVNMDSKFSI